MRFLERLSLVIFSLLILILSVIVCMLTVGILNLSTVNVIILNALNNITVSNIMLGVAIILILLSLRNIFFSSSSSNKRPKEESPEGVLLQNENGQLLISKQTLENLVNNIAKGFEGTKNVATKVILDKDNNLSVQVVLFVEENAVIKDLSSKIQTKIKEDVKTSSDLDVKEVNIQIKNIAPQEENTTEN